MSLGTITVTLFNPGLATLELGPSEDHTHLSVTRVVDGEWFIIDLLKEVVRQEKHAAASVRGSRIRELVEVIKTDTNRGLPKNEAVFIAEVLPGLLSRTTAWSPSGPYLREERRINISYGSDGTSFWKDQITRLRVSTES